LCSASAGYFYGRRVSGGEAVKARRLMTHQGKTLAATLVVWFVGPLILWVLFQIRFENSVVDAICDIVAYGIAFGYAFTFAPLHERIARWMPK
jgi:RsiW-degrading membrane proteinase PrsW (M82 family)